MMPLKQIGTRQESNVHEFYKIFQSWQSQITDIQRSIHGVNNVNVGDNNEETMEEATMKELDSMIDNAVDLVIQNSTGL